MSKKMSRSFEGLGKLGGLGPMLLLLATACGGVAGEGEGNGPDEGDLDSEPETGQVQSAIESAGCKAGRTEAARIRTAAGIRDVSFCRLSGNRVIFDGDIVVDSTAFENARVDLGGGVRAVFTLGAGRWSNGVVPFVVAASLPSQTRVTDAIAHWQQNTPYRFVARTSQADYVEFVPGTGCSSDVGRKGGRQEVRLGTGCSSGSTIHEIGHAIGFFHEQSRADRDEYVTVHPECIQTGFEHDFAIADGLVRGPYDYQSIMHYPRRAFSNGCETLTPLTPGAVIGQRVGLSVGDILSAYDLRFGSRPMVRAVPADYDGDGKDDMSLKDDTGAWRIDFANGGFARWDAQIGGYGNAGATPVPADYDGDGKADLAIKSNAGDWFIDLAADGFLGWNRHYTAYGFTDVTPVPADYDGDGKADLSVKSNAGDWFIDYAADGFGAWNAHYTAYGFTDVTPVPADYDGDGKADLSVKSNGGDWFIDYAADGFGAWNAHYTAYGFTDVTPVPADYDGDGKADLSVKSDGGDWFIDYAADGFGAWNAHYTGYGSRDATPVPADYDGDGKTDLAVKGTTGAAIWYVDYARGGFGAWNVTRIVGG